MSKLRASARGQQCQVRLPCCNHDSNTVVGAHYRMAGYCGTGMKPPDAPFMAYACYSCHQIIDSRELTLEGYSRADIRLAHAEACLRTMDLMIKDGLVEVKG